MYLLLKGSRSSPDAATSLIGLFCSFAMKPIMEKMANPEKKLVPELMAQTINDCLFQSVFKLRKFISNNQSKLKSPAHR